MSEDKSPEQEMYQDDDNSTDKEQEQTENSETKALAKKATLPTSKEERDEALAEVWNNTQLIRKYFAPNLNKKEFALFIGKGRMLGANPFTEEIYPTKIKGKMKTMLSRDFYRRKAQEQDTYDGHRAVAIYENDDFKLVNGKPQHEVNSFADRGDIVGAYAVGWRTDVDHMFYEDVRFDEYDQGNYMWNAKPDTMIKKVAESHLLRLMYEGILGNTYTPEEIGEEMDNANQTTDDHEATEAVIIGEDEDD